MRRHFLSKKPKIFHSRPHARFKAPQSPLSSIIYFSLDKKRDIAMGACGCGYTTDPEKNCNGTHKVVKAVKEDLAVKLEANGFPHAAEYVRNN